MNFFQAVRQLQRHYEGERELTEQQLETHWSYVKKPSLPVISTLPFEALPRRITQHTSMERYSLDRCIENEGITINPLLNIGLCSVALEFRGTLFYPNSPNYMNLTVIYMNDELMGVVKHNGHPAFLALTTVKDETKYPLIRGGIYAIPFEMRRSFQKERRYHTMDLDSLAVKPKKMLYNDTKTLTDFLKEIPKIRRKVLRERS